MTGRARYAAVLRTPDVARLLAAALLARLPLGIDALAIVLFIRDRTGTFADAGAVVAAFGVGVAVSQPLFGRMIDRRGHAPVLVPLAFLHAGAAGLIVGLGLADAPLAALLPAGLAAGVTLPPVGSVVRPLLGVLFAPAPDLMPAAYALDAVLIETAFVVGPLLTALVITLVGSGAALGLAGALVLVGTLTLVTAPASRAWQPQPAGTARLIGALESVGVRTVTFCAIPFGFSVGATEVALPAFAADVASAAVAGVLLALWSVGSAAGGLTYGARSAGDRPDHSFVRLALLLPLTCLPLIGAWSLAAMVVLVMIAGAGIAPLMSASNHLVGELAPPGTVTEAYAWPITALALGVAAGNAAAGAIIDAEGWRAAFVVAAGGAAATPVLAVSRRRTLTTS